MRVYKSKIVACGDSGAGKRTMIATRDAMSIPFQLLGIMPVIRVFSRGEDEFHFNAWIIDERTVKNDAMKRMCFKGSTGVIIIVDASRGDRVDVARKWIGIYRSASVNDGPVILAGTKADAIPADQLDDVVKDLSDVAKESGIRFVQTSAVLGMNVDKPMEWMIDQQCKRE